MKPTKYICSWSGGKDSTATIILCHEKGIPLDLIIFAEVMYDAKRGISGEDPEHIKWIKEQAIPLFELWGYKTEIIHSTGANKDFLDLFHHVVKKEGSKNCGKKAGYLISGKCSGNQYLKIRPIQRRLSAIRKEYNIIQYIGIAADEPTRLARLKDDKISLLAEYNIAEADTYSICSKYGLLSPLYQHCKRGGCWFCPNAGIPRFARFAKMNPEIWREFVNLGHTPDLASRNFKRGNISIFDIDRRVQAYIENEEKAPIQETLF